MSKPITQFIIDTNPLPKQRARVANGHGYTPERTRDYERLVSQLANISMMGTEAYGGDVELVVIFHREGKRRADLDNMLKAISDGMNGIVYADDKQIVSIQSVVMYGCSSGYTEVYVLKASNVLERLINWLSKHL